MAMAAFFINGPRPFVQISNPPLTESSGENLKKIGLGVSEEILFKGVEGRRTKGQTEDGRRVITIAHPEPLAQARKILGI